MDSLPNSLQEEEEQLNLAIALSLQDHFHTNNDQHSYLLTSNSQDLISNQPAPQRPSRRKSKYVLPLL